MNKMVKLPLFLGICGGVCAGILAGVYAFTNPIITKNTEKAAYQAIYQAFAEFGNEDTLSVSKPMTLSSELKNAGVYNKQSVTGGSLNDGMVYACTTTTKGYGGVISFQVTFANGKFLAYTDLGNSETKSMIGNMNNIVSGSDASGYALAIVSGETFTSKALKSAIDVIAADYAAASN